MGMASVFSCPLVAPSARAGPGAARAEARIQAAHAPTNHLQGMTRLQRTVLAALLAPAIAAHAAPCFKYDTETVVLKGRVKVETFYGPPNYGESPATDSREQQAVLYLNLHLCTQESDDDPAETHQRRVTLVPLGGLSLKPFVGKEVSVKGKLFHATTGHHHTPVLIAVEQAPTIER